MSRRPSAATSLPARFGASSKTAICATIRFGGVEIVRAINYLARDASWGTYKPCHLQPARSRKTTDAFAVDL